MLFPLGLPVFASIWMQLEWWNTTWDIATPRGVFSWSLAYPIFRMIFVKLPVHSVSLRNSSNTHLGGRELQPEQHTRSRALAQEIFCVFLSVIHPASVIPAEPVLHTHAALATCEEQVWGGEIFSCFSLPRFALNLHLECWLRSCPWLSCWPSGWGTEMGTGTDPPSLLLSRPPSPTAAGTNCQGAARPHGFMAFFLSLLMCLLVSMMLCRGTTRQIVSSWGGCPGICTASWYGTGAPAFSVTPGAIDGRLGLCCCCCTDACSWPTLKGQDIPWFRLAIYCRGCQHLRHSYPAELSPTWPALHACSLSSVRERGAVTQGIWGGSGGLFSSLLLRSVFHLTLHSAVHVAHPLDSPTSISFPQHSTCLGTQVMEH